MLLQVRRNHGDSPHCRHGLLRDQLQDVDDGDVTEALGDAQRRRPVLKTRGQMLVKSPNCVQTNSWNIWILQRWTGGEGGRLTDVISLG